MNIGDTIKTKRKQLGLSARKLSRNAGVSSSLIAMIESGARGARLSLDSAEKIAAALGISVGELSGFGQQEPIK